MSELNNPDIDNNSDSPDDFYGDVFKDEYLIVNSSATSKSEVFDQIDAICFKQNISNIPGAVKRGLLDREREGITGMEYGFAIPHCRIKEILKSAIIVVKLHTPMEWPALDGKKTNFVIALLSNDSNTDNIHLKLLSGVARRLISPDNRAKLQKSESFETIAQILVGSKPPLNLPNSKQPTTVPLSATATKHKPLMVGVTGCTVGIAHTFFAADKLAEGAKALNFRYKIETHGADGIGNELSLEEIKEADFVIIAADINIPEDRFVNKRLYKCSTREAIQDPIGTIKKALLNKSTVQLDLLKHKSAIRPAPAGEQDLFGLKDKSDSVVKHLLSGVSYMIPIVILGGLLLALSLGLSKAIYGPNYNVSDHPDSFWAALQNIGSSAFTLMIAVLGGFIAVSIGGKAALAPALVVSYVGNDSKFFSKWLFHVTNASVSDGNIAPMGFVGSLIAGFAIGYTVRWMRTWKMPKSLRPIMPIIIIPILCGFVYGMLFIYLLGSLVGYVTYLFQSWLKTAWGGSGSSVSLGIGIGLGALIGAMAGFDVGGPVNKTAFLTAVSLITLKVYTPMGAMAEAIPVAPLGMGIASLMFKKTLDPNLKSAGQGALVMGVIGISEGSIPFILSKPKQAVTSNLVTSAIAGALAGWYGTACTVAQGGPIVVLLGATGRTVNSINSIGFGNWQAILINLSIMIGCGLLNALFFGYLISQFHAPFSNKIVRRFVEFTSSLKNKVYQGKKTSPNEPSKISVTYRAYRYATLHISRMNSNSLILQN